MKNEENWAVVIRPNSGWFDLSLKSIWRYRDLLWLFVKRDIITVYQQTVLGPLWYLIQPILTTLMFTFVFEKIANISTDGLPPIIFYMCGITFWNYFSDCLNRTSNTFVVNQHIFGKVYFPRITVPGSIVISTLIRFGIQFGIFFVLAICYYFSGAIKFNYCALFLPLIIFIMAMMSMGFGMIFSSFTTKYRDLQFLLTFAVQLWMYVTPIIYPLSSIPENYQKIIRFNPVTPLIEVMRFGFLGKGFFSWGDLLYSLIFAFTVFFVGVLIFTKVEKNFMDTV